LPVTAAGEKPVIAGRFQLWNGVFYNVSALAAMLLKQPRSAATQAGYSLIPVHVWTNNVSSVVELVEALAAAAPDGSMRVVTPDQFVAALYANIAPGKRSRRERTTTAKMLI